VEERILVYIADPVKMATTYSEHPDRRPRVPKRRQSCTSALATWESDGGVSRT